MKEPSKDMLAFDDPWVKLFPRQAGAATRPRGEEQRAILWKRKPTTSWSVFSRLPRSSRLSDLSTGSAAMATVAKRELRVRILGSVSGLRGAARCCSTASRSAMFGACSSTPTIRACDRPDGCQRYDADHPFHAGRHWPCRPHRTGLHRAERRGFQGAQLLDEAEANGTVAEIVANPSAVTNLLQTAQDIFKRADTCLRNWKGLSAMPVGR